MDTGTARCCRTRELLHKLTVFRSAAIAAQTAILGFAYAVLEIRFPLAPVIGGLVCYTLVDAATLLRLRHSWPVTGTEIFAQVLIDMAALAVLLYFTGGALNPFAAGYMILVLYALIALVAWFGVRLDELHRSGVQVKAERAARERYLLGLATLSAGTAHEISTPLSTMSILVGELRRTAEPPPEWKKSIDMLWGQIQICRRSLTTMARAADVERLGKVERVCARQFIHDVANRFELQRPAVPLKLRLVHLDDALMLESDHTLPQALLNFLNNAADASPGSVELRCAEKEDLLLVIQVLDRGPGIAPQLRERIGKGLITTKAPGRGSGAGVLIANAVIERFGGTVQVRERSNGGTCIQIELPLFRVSRENENEHPGLRVAG